MNKLIEPEYTIHIDGASRGNPGPASYGFAVLNQQKEVLHEGSGYIGETTNNVAEYTALIKALEFALKHDLKSVEVKTDSQLLARQLTGQYRVKTEHIELLYRRCRELLRRFAVCEITHVAREENRIADRLANLALDRRKL